MTIREISAWLLENRGFQEQYRSLIIDSVLLQFRGRVRPLIQYSFFDHDWHYLLTCAGILASSSDGESQAAALRIAQHCLSIQDTPPNRRDSAALVLDGLSNYPAIQLAISRNLLAREVQERLPFPAKLDWVRRSIENSILLSNDEMLKANRFQNQFWSSVTEHDWVSVSAPTSAGKSFIVEQWVAEFLRENALATVAYVVPTRALISQVQEDLTRFLHEARMTNVSVSSTPVQRAFVAGVSNVLIFTQERLHIFLTAFTEEPQIDALIIDEAHKVGDRHRGVLLQQVIERVVVQNPRTKVIFASPLADNPEVLIADAARDVRADSFVSEDVTVNLGYSSRLRHCLRAGSGRAWPRCGGHERVT